MSIKYLRDPKTQTTEFGTCSSMNVAMLDEPISFMGFNGSNQTGFQGTALDTKRANHGMTQAGVSLEPTDPKTQLGVAFSNVDYINLKRRNFLVRIGTQNFSMDNLLNLNRFQTETILFVVGNANDLKFPHQSECPFDQQRHSRRSCRNTMRYSPSDCFENGPTQEAKPC